LWVWENSHSRWSSFRGLGHRRQQTVSSCVKSEVVSGTRCRIVMKWKSSGLPTIHELKTHSGEDTKVRQFLVSQSNAAQQIFEARIAPDRVIRRIYFDWRHHVRVLRIRFLQQFDSPVFLIGTRIRDQPD
jgi:hypothetical protein